MKVRFFENSGDMLLMAAFDGNTLVYAHDYDGDIERARNDADAAIITSAEEIAQWSGNILDDGVVLEDQYGCKSSDAFAKWISDNDTGDTNTGIAEIDIDD